MEGTYDIPVTRSALNLNLSAKLPELLDELTRACAENLDPHIADSVCGTFIPLPCDNIANVRL